MTLRRRPAVGRRPNGVWFSRDKASDKPAPHVPTTAEVALLAHAAGRFLEGLPDAIPAPTSTSVVTTSDDGPHVELSWHEFHDAPDDWTTSLAYLISMFPSAAWVADASFGVALVSAEDVYPDGDTGRIDVRIFTRTGFTTLAAAVGRLT